MSGNREQYSPYESREVMLLDALMVAADLLEQEGYDSDPDYRQEWQTIKDALGAKP